MDEYGEVVELEQALEQVARVAAIDIAKASAMVCTRLAGERNPQRRVQRTWPVASSTNAIAELADHLVCQGVQLVVMEATSDHWRPFFYLLEARGLTCWMVNARDVKNVPGRPKTDKLDAIWLARTSGSSPRPGTWCRGRSCPRARSSPGRSPRTGRPGRATRGCAAR